MAGKTRFTLLLRIDERIALQRLSRADERSQGATIRYLIRKAARERGLIAPRPIQVVELGESNQQPSRVDMSD